MEDKTQGGLSDELLESLSEEDRRLLEKYSHTFIGTYSHSLDNKGRLIIPQAFRDQLGDTFCVGPSFNFKSVALYPTLVWARLRDGYAKLSAYDARLKRFLEQFDAMSYRDQELDTQGRILLPVRIRQRILGESKEIEVSGSGDYIRLSPAESSDQDYEKFMEELDDIQLAIGELSKQQ